MTKRKIEIFTGNCPLCDETVQLVQEMVSSSCEVEVYNLLEGLENPICGDKVKQYRVNAVPAIAIDGMLVFTGKPNREQLQSAGVGQPYFATNGFLYLGMGI